MARAERSLREVIAREVGRNAGQRRLHGTPGSVPLTDLLDLTCLSGDVAERRVLVATRDPFLAVIALIALDGLAEALILCPPDVLAEELPRLAALGRAECLLTDRPRRDVPGLDALTLIDCAWPPVPAARESEFERATAWLLPLPGRAPRAEPRLQRRSFADLRAALGPAPDPADDLIWASLDDIRRASGLPILLRSLLGPGSLAVTGPEEDGAGPLDNTLRRLGRLGATHVSGTPAQWRRVLASPEGDAVTPAWIGISGSGADPALRDALARVYPDARIDRAPALAQAA